MVNVTKLFYHLFKKNHKNYSFRGFQRKLSHLINLISKKTKRWSFHVYLNKDIITLIAHQVVHQHFKV